MQRARELLEVLSGNWFDGSISSDRIVNSKTHHSAVLKMAQQWIQSQCQAHHRRVEM